MYEEELAPGQRLALLGDKTGERICAFELPKIKAHQDEGENQSELNPPPNSDGFAIELPDDLEAAFKLSMLFWHALGGYDDGEDSASQETKRS